MAQRSTQRHPIAIAWTCALAVVVVAGCTATTAPKPVKTIQVGGREVPLHEHMQEQFNRTGVMQRALIAGDLDRVRKEAKWVLAQPNPQGIPQRWIPFVEQLRLAAAEVAQATEADAVAHGVGEMGAACGSCHERLTVDVNPTAEPAPPASAGRRAHMLRHQWATDRLWDGLVAANDDVWFAAAEVFRDKSLAFEDPSAARRTDPHRQNLEDHLHGLGEEAERTMAIAQRARLFGKLAATCARCHNLRATRQTKKL